MCPPSRPSPPAEIGLYWTDEQIFSLLNEYTPGSCLPNNVLLDPSPYQFQPSNLPEGVWYLAHSNEKKESNHGFWKAKGEACKVYSNSTMTGLRTTLEYFEGQAPIGQRTDWLMQEYRVTEKELCDKDKPKESSRLLCRVFLCNGHSSESKTSPQNEPTEPKIDLVASIHPNTNITSGQDSRSESKPKTEHEVGQLLVLTGDKSNSSVSLSEQDYIERGDFLELDDLEDPDSNFTSSQNSSCPSKLSDEYFDSLALWRDIEEEENRHLWEQQSSSRHNFVSSARPNDIILQPPSSGSLLSNVVEGRRTDSTIHEFAEVPQTDSTIQESLRPSTSYDNGVSRGEKKTGSRSFKKLKTYFCFAAF